MKSQFASCSYETFKPVPFAGEKETSEDTSNRIGEVKLLVNVTGE